MNKQIKNKQLLCCSFLSVTAVATALINWNCVLFSMVSHHWLTTTHVINISMKSEWLPVWGKMLAQTQRYDILYKYNNK